MIHKKLNMITWNFILPVLLSGMSLAGDHLSKKEEMVETILMLPPSLFYEESRSAFQERIKEGKFWIDPEENRAYLLITGDGSFGKRLFVLDSTSLYIIHCGNEEEGGGKEYAFYRYDRQHKEVSLIAAFKQSLFDNR